MRVTIHKILAPVLAIAFSAIAPSGIAADTEAAAAKDRIVFLNLTGVHYDLNIDSPMLEYGPWTKEEEETIKTDLQALEVSHPYLLNTLWKQTPRLFLAKTIPKANFTGSDSYLYTACTGPTRIVFNPRYFTFKPARRGDTLYHELIHRLDVGQRVGLSSGWCKLVNPLTGRIRVQVACGQIKPGKSPIEPLPKELNWPNYYACESPVEALAVYCAETERGSFPVRVELTPAIESLFHPTDKDLVYAKAYQDGQLEMEYHLFEKAIPLFRKAVEIHPDAATAHCNLAHCLMMSKRYQSSLIEVNKSIDLLNKSHLPQSEQHFKRVLELQAHVLGTLHRWKDLKASYDRRLLFDPDDLKILRRRMLVNETLHNWSAAAYDCYNLKYHDSNITSAAIKAACEDDKFTRECLELALSKQSKANPLAMPIFFEWLAAKAESARVKKANLEQVLATLPTTVEEPTNERVTLLKAKTLISLGRYTEVETCIAKLRKIAPESPALLVLEIALKQARQEPAEEDFRRLKSKLEKSK